MTDQPATRTHKATTTRTTTASAAQAVTKTINDAIVVTEEPKNMENKEDNATCPAPSATMCRTPAKTKTRPGTPPGAPIKPKPRQMTPFDVTESDDDDDDKTMIHTTENAIKTPAPRQIGGSMSHLIEVLRKAKDKLSTQRTSGAGLEVKIEVIKELEKAIQEAEKQNTVQVDRTSNIENDLKEIKTTLNEVIATKITRSENQNKFESKTWAQIAAQGANTSKSQEIDQGKTERLDKLRREREKVEFTLSARNANDETKKQLSNMNEKELIKVIQDASGLDLRGIRKLSNHRFQIRCLVEKDAETLRNMNWEDAISGTTVIKRTYGIVMHGVPKYDVDFEKDDLKELKARIAKANDGRIQIDKIAPLRRRTRNPNATTQSIVIFTDHPEEADECIESGIIIEHRIHKAERYMRQGQIRQCFNCQGYGHEANVCKKKPRCGKCAENHATKECNREKLRCAHCSEEHAAWHRECPRRQRESAQKEAIREAMPPLYTRSC